MTANLTAKRAAHTRAAPKAPAGAAAPDAVPARDVRAAVDHQDRIRELDAYVRRLIGRVLGVAPHLVDTEGRPMNSLGIGSIAGLELQRRMERDLHVRVDLQRLLLAGSAAELVDCLAGQPRGRARTGVDPA